MIFIQFPNHSFNVKQADGRDIIFDNIRKQWLQLTPEEWVRQNFIQYLTLTLQYPQSHFAIEKEIRIGDLQRRFDVVIYNKAAKPWMLIECKAMDVPLADVVIEQALRYNQKVQANFLVITNGTYTRCFQLLPQVSELTALPIWSGE